MRIYCLVAIIFLSNFVFAKKDDIREHQIHLYDNPANNSDSCTINTSKGIFSFKLSDANDFKNSPNDFKNSSLINSLELREQLLVEAITKELVCRKTYKMTGHQKDKLLSSDYQDIVRELLNLEHLSDQQIWQLWEEYKQKHRVRVGSNNKYEQELKNSLSKRKKERDKQRVQEQEIKKKAEQQQVRQQKEQEQRIQEQQRQELLKKYNPKILNSFDDGLDQKSHYISSYYQQREQALQQTINDGGKQHVRGYELDTQTQALLQMQGIDHHQFKSLSGTIFSHQLFCECADHYQRAAKVVFEYGLKNSVLIHHLINFIQAAFEGTKYEQFALAVNLSNMAEILANSSVSICKGILRSPIELIDLSLHAKQLAASLFKLTLNLGQILVAYDGIDSTNLISTKIEQKLADENAQIVHELCSISRSNFKDWCKNSSGQEKLEETSKLIADFTTTLFIFCKSLKGCTGILVEAKNAVNFQRVVEFAEELGLGFQEAEELLLATEVGVPKLPITAAELEIAATSLMKSEVDAVIKGLELSVIKDLLPFIEEFRSMGGVIPFENKIFKNQFKEALKKLEKQLKNPILEQIIKKYGEKIIDNKKVRAYLEHICNFDLGLKKSKIAGGYILDVGGGHLSGVCEALEQTGLIKIVGKNKLSNGVIDYTMQDIFTGNPIYKTVLPEKWTIEKIGDIVWEVFETGTDIVTSKNWFKYKRIEDVDISLYLRTTKQQGNALDLIEIVTLLPYKISSGAA
ncbi:hypothetical protein HYV10_04415 [Candidatus Dependentiae bacterium]|nr:hypothetical protein [Candidatus Dependentiae bacterium]